MTRGRIALFTESLGGGGAERVMATLANGFDQAGFEVDLVLIRGTGPFLRDLSPSVRVHDLGARRTLLSLLPMIRYLRSARPEVMVATQAHVNIIAVLARVLSRVPVRLFVRESNTPSVIAKNAGGFGAWAKLGAMRVSYMLAERIVAPSHGVKDDLTRRMRFPAAHVEVIQNPLPLAAIRERAGAPVRHPWFDDRSVPVVVGVGRLSLQKDFDTLLRAFAVVRRVRPARLMILGEGEERGALERQITELGLQDHVSLPGFVDNPWAYLRSSAVYVLSSPSEGSPNTLLEALAVGVPAVATDCVSGPREILEGGRWGRLVPVGDADAMAAAIIAALDGDVSGPSTADMADRYDVSVIVGRYASLLAAVPGHASSPVRIVSESYE